MSEANNGGQVGSTMKDIEIENQKISVLLVDDQAMVAEGVRRILATDPVMVFHYVSDPRRALEAALKIGPTLILQDLLMPGVNGLDLLKEYRNNPFTRAVPVIVLSSKEEPATKQMAFESGANDYIVKMPHRIELLARVRLHSAAYLHELQQQRAFLALKASQQTLTEKNCELTLLNQKLEEATRFKSEFFTNVSHELRTSLMAVLGMAEILYDTSLTIYQRELVDVIRTSGEVLSPIINDILDLSRIDSGRLELESVPFVLREVVDQAMDLLAPVAFEKGLEISAWIDQRLASTVVGDITRVRQVLLNVLNNAINFTSVGEIYLEVDPSADGDNMIHFCLRDTGVGIPPEMIDRLFQSFVQVDAWTNRRFGSDGLGLSICHKLTALMGGRMWAESTVGEGTQFHFLISLPAPSIGVLPDVNNVSGSLEKVSGEDLSFSWLNILVVDDINVNRRVCVAQLQKLGVRKISEAGDGNQAIAAAQSQAFDLILMDVQMPGIDGLQATHQIRELLSNARQPRIIGLTANALSEERERCLRAGMDDKLTKPLRIGELQAVLEAIGK